MRYNYAVGDPTLRSGWRLVLAMVIPLAGGAACFSPDVQEGLACSPSGTCPYMQVCVDTVCIEVGSEVPRLDAAGVAITPDARGGDADTSCAANTLLCDDECLTECTREFSVAGESSYPPELGCSYLRAHVWGAGAGHGVGNTLGSAGGYALVERVVTDEESYTVLVGAPGGNGQAGGGAGLGGVPGGGNGGTGNNRGGGGGGGYSGLFLGGTAAINAIVIGGGGGGSGAGTSFPNNTIGGAGGGAAGQAGSPAEGNNLGGTQTTGFAPLQGDIGGNGDDGAGGGGGGWYGGMAGTGANDDAQGAGGGSGYVGTAAVSELATGDRSIPGKASLDTLIGMAAKPTMPGKVVLICYAEAPTI